jgi:hypothetical protein
MVFDICCMDEVANVARVTCARVQYPVATLGLTAPARLRNVVAERLDKPELVLIISAADGEVVDSTLLTWMMCSQVVIGAADAAACGATAIPFVGTAHLKFTIRVIAQGTTVPRLSTLSAWVIPGVVMRLRTLAVAEGAINECPLHLCPQVGHSAAHYLK